MPVPDGMKRRVVDLPLPVDFHLQEASLVDHVTPAMRIRAMVEVWASDEHTKARVDEAAQRLHGEVKARQRQRAAEMRAQRWPATSE